MSDYTRYQNLGEVVEATQVTDSTLEPRQVRTIILLLAACVALMMTGFGIIMPVFARRLGELGSGVEALGLMTMSFALAQFIAAPFMGTLADRLGRRPLVLTALAAFAVANIGFLLAPSTQVFIAVRTVEGALTAGLFPAAMGVVADTVPENQRARWVGIVMGSYGAGFIFGPVMGGILYDGWGFAAPFVASAAMGSIALLAAAILVPETRTQEVRQRHALRRRRDSAMVPTRQGSLWTSLPRPLYIFGVLLILDFIGVFAFAFVEPQMIFYFYEGLGWTTVQFGIVVGVYGLAMVLGQVGLGQASDRFGRRPIIILGMLLTVTFYIGLAAVIWFPLTILVAFIAGLGMALTSPAVSAFYLDITEEQHRSRVVGIKESSAALGGVAGPLAVAAVSSRTTPRGIFIIASVLMLAAAVLALVALRAPDRVAEETENVEWEYSGNRAMAAQTALRGVVLSATNTRAARQVA
jgi:DHA1 family tetracycline resistance protein-like MFS transporter